MVQPDHVHGQLESAVIYGLSAALIEQLSVKDGSVQATNFDSYPVMRMSEVPEIHTRILATNNPPSGMGEIGVVTVAPEIANAVFQLTGKRLRHLPMTADRVRNGSSEWRSFGLGRWKVCHHRLANSTAERIGSGDR